MKYKITVDIGSSEKLNPRTLQTIKHMVEETVIENLEMPKGASVFVNSKVTKDG